MWSSISPGRCWAGRLPSVVSFGQLNTIKNTPVLFFINHRSIRCPIPCVSTILSYNEFSRRS
jgi:hypothetical protein